MSKNNEKSKLMNNEENKPMNKNLNDVVELTESQLAHVVGGGNARGAFDLSDRTLSQSGTDVDSKIPVGPGKPAWPYV